MGHFLPTFASGLITLDGLGWHVWNGQTWISAKGSDA